MTKFIIIYLLIINLIAFSAMGIDKKRAKKNQWRIQEKVLFIFVLLGGGIGGTLGMHIFHHKTKHWYFLIGFPFITIIEYVGVIFLYFKFR